jgi:uncharacterized protein with von Willebrand factor type A (vWA) domain
MDDIVEDDATITLKRAIFQRESNYAHSAGAKEERGEAGSARAAGEGGAAQQEQEEEHEHEQQQQQQEEQEQEQEEGGGAAGEEVREGAHWQGVHH